MNCWKIILGKYTCEAVKYSTEAHYHNRNGLREENELPAFNMAPSATAQTTRSPFHYLRNELHLPIKMMTPNGVEAVSDDNRATARRYRHRPFLLRSKAQNDTIVYYRIYYQHR